LIAVITACGSDTESDTTSPVITITGGNPLTIIQGDHYIDEGATANDDVDGGVTVSVNGSVQTSIPGEYIITYTATDSADNTATSTRSVTVLTPDLTPPTLTLNGASSLTLFVNDSYEEQGAIATDNRDSDLNIIITGSVDTTISGDYVITYLVIDSSGNSSSVTRLISVAFPDTTPPVITLNGASSVRLLLNDTYVEEGATATDNQDPAVVIIISGNIDVSNVGEYSITYTATDNSGNLSIAIRTISIVNPSPFITTWNTDIESEDEEANKQVTIHTRGSGYNYQVNWGDGSLNERVNGDITHTYSVSGTYTVSINGDFPQIYFNLDSDNKKLKSIEQWGDIKWGSMHKAFYKTVNLHVNATDVPDLSNVNDMSYMFSQIDSLTSTQNAWDWDVSAVINMKSMFDFATTFNQDISTWDVSSVTDISNMFRAARVFNTELEQWDTSSVTKMSGVFSWAYEFNQNINSWNISSVNNLSNVFFAAKKFNQPLDNWDTSSTTNMSKIFDGAYKFNQDINNWNVSSVTDMSEMFLYAFRFNQGLSNWDVSSVTTMAGMFYRAIDFNQSISNWDVSSVQSMKNMFECFSATCAFDQDISHWDITSIKYNGMEDMFAHTKLSTTHYDQLLVTWSKLNLESNVNLNAGSSTYSASSQDAKNTLVNDYGWTITDGGTAP
jgi:bacterial surface protein 26-residue repeat